MALNSGLNISRLSSDFHLEMRSAYTGRLQREQKNQCHVSYTMMESMFCIKNITQIRQYSLQIKERN